MAWSQGASVGGGSHAETDLNMCTLLTKELALVPSLEGHAGRRQYLVQYSGNALVPGSQFRLSLLPETGPLLLLEIRASI